MRRIYLCSVIIAAASFRCAHVRTAPVDPHVSATCGDDSDLSFVTYNAALAPGINDLASPRLPHVAKAIGEVEADVLCVQEAWTPAASDAVAGARRARGDRVIVPDLWGRHEDPADRCDPGDLESVMSCAEERCAGVPDEDVGICAAKECRAKLLWLYVFSRRCLNCLIASTGNGTKEIVRRCTAGSASRVYGGGSGIVLASRFPLEEPEIVELPSSGANRVAVFARVRAPNGVAVEVACTHLTSEQQGSPTHHAFDSWPSEMHAQYRIIAARLRERARGNPAVLVGDMNFGPSIGAVADAQTPELWNEAVADGFSSPGADAVRPFCTVCPENTLRSGESGRCIDHVLFRNPPRGGNRLAPVCAERLFDRTREIEAYGKPVPTHLSDHYGVRVRFRTLPPGP